MRNKGMSLGKELEKVVKLKNDADKAYEKSESEYIESFIKLTAEMEAVMPMLKKLGSSKSKEEALSILDKVNLERLDKQLNKVYEITDVYKYYSDINRLFNEK